MKKTTLKVECDNAYVIGDLSHVLSKEEWRKACEAGDAYAGSGYALHSTKYGDGMFDGSSGFGYIVESGTLGIALCEACPKGRLDTACAKGYVRIATGRGEAALEYKAGEFTFRIGDAQVEHIDTSDRGCNKQQDEVKNEKKVLEVLDFTKKEWASKNFAENLYQARVFANEGGEQLCAFNFMALGIYDAGYRAMKILGEHFPNIKNAYCVTSRQRFGDWETIDKMCIDEDGICDYGAAWYLKRLKTSG